MISVSFREITMVSGAAGITTVLSSFRSFGCNWSAQNSFGLRICSESQGWPAAYYTLGEINWLLAIFNFIFYFLIFGLVLIMVRKIIYRLRW